MSKARWRGLLAALPLIALPAALSSQQPAAPPQLTPEVQSWITEIQQIQAELMRVQQRALEDPGLQAEQQGAMDAVRSAMLQADPGIEEVIERMESLMSEAEAAGAAGDQARLAELSAEAQEMQPRYARAQAAALQQPQVQASIEAFQVRLQGRMVEMEPGAERRIQRLEELNRRVTAAMQGTAQP